LFLSVRPETCLAERVYHNLAGSLFFIMRYHNGFSGHIDLDAAHALQASKSRFDAVGAPAACNSLY